MHGTISKVKDKKIWVSINQSMDSVGRHIANVIVPSNLYIGAYESLDSVNYINVSELFKSTLHQIWPSSVQHENMLIYFIDAATYIIKSRKVLKSVPKYDTYNISNNILVIGLRKK